MKLRDLYSIFANHPESSWIMEPQNAQLLYKFVMEHPIKRVLDLGTGIGASAATVALALKDKGETDYHIDSIEQYDKCVDIAHELIPKELQEHLTIYKANVTVCDFPQISYQYFSVFDKLPEESYDLIINDGPGPFLQGENYIDLPNGTIIKLLLEEKLKPGTFVVWDGRLHMLKILERYFSNNFLLERAAQRGDDMNILERIDNPISFRDDKLLEMQEGTNYFHEKVTNPNNSSSTLGENATPHQGA